MKVHLGCYFGHNSTLSLLRFVSYNVNLRMVCLCSTNARWYCARTISFQTIIMYTIRGRCV